MAKPTIECPECKGACLDNHDCETCAGDGWVADPEDGGTMTCPDCDGGSKCNVCDGEGVVDAPGDAS